MGTDDPDANCVELGTRDESDDVSRPAEPRGRIPVGGWAAHFDATAHQVDAEFDAATVTGHWQRARHAAVARLVGNGSGPLLEIGTGSGRLLAELADRGWTVTGLDPAPGMVELARSRVPAARGRITVGQAESLPFDDDSFDVVVCIGVLGFVDVEPALDELVRVLRPDGRAVLGVFDRHAATVAWQQYVVFPVARAVKRVAPFGRPLPWSHRSFTPSEIRRLLAVRRLAVERVEQVGCAVLPDPLDRFLPRLAWRAAEAAERSRSLRRLLGTQYVLVAGKPPVPGTDVPVPGTAR
jgi:ubiquinone/menaquinone biosynthesis C-methylase UbiE